MLCHIKTRESCFLLSVHSFTVYKALLIWHYWSYFDKLPDNATSLYRNNLGLTENILMFYYLQFCHISLLHTQIPLISLCKPMTNTCVLQQVLFVRIKSFFQLCTQKRKLLTLPSLHFHWEGNISQGLSLFCVCVEYFCSKLNGNLTMNDGSLLHTHPGGPPLLHLPLSFMLHTLDILHSVLEIEWKDKWHIPFLSPWSS